MSATDSILKAISDWITPALTKEITIVEEPIDFLIEKGDVAGHSFHGNQYTQIAEATSKASDLVRGVRYQRRSANERNGDKSWQNRATIVHNSLDAKNVAEQAKALQDAGQKVPDEFRQGIVNDVLQETNTHADAKVLQDDLNKAYKDYTGSSKTLLDSNGQLRSGRLDEITNTQDRNLLALKTSQDAMNTALQNGDLQTAQDELSTFVAYSRVTSMTANFLSAIERVTGDQQTALNYRNQSNDLSKGITETVTSVLQGVADKGVAQATEAIASAENPPAGTNASSLYEKANDAYSNSYSALRDLRGYLRNDQPAMDAVSAKIDALASSISGLSDKMNTAIVNDNQSIGYKALEDMVSATTPEDAKIALRFAQDAFQKVSDAGYSLRRSSDPTANALGQVAQQNSDSGSSKLSNASNYIEAVASFKIANDLQAQLANTTDPVERANLSQQSVDAYQSATSSLNSAVSSRYSTDGNPTVSDIGKFVDSPLFNPNLASQLQSASQQATSDNSIIQTVGNVAKGDKSLASISPDRTPQENYYSAKGAQDAYQQAQNAISTIDLKTTAGALAVKQNIDQIISINQKVEAIGQVVLENRAPYYASQVASYLAGTGDTNINAMSIANTAIADYNTLATNAGARGDTVSQASYVATAEQLAQQADAIRQEQLFNQHRL
jgi:hypothetical protein